jgi:Thioesterase superfamily
VPGAATRLQHVPCTRERAQAKADGGSPTRSAATCLGGETIVVCGGDREPVQVRCVIPRAAHPRVLVVRRVPADMEVLTAEFKVNLLTPASGNSLVAEGQVVRAGRTLTVCRGDAFSGDVERVHVATMLATIIGRPAS